MGSVGRVTHLFDVPLSRALGSRNAVAPSSLGRRLALSVTAVVGLATISACVASDAGRLVEYQDGAGGVVAIDETTPGEVIAFDDIVFCKMGEGVVEIEKVELVEPTGELAVVGFSVLPAGRDGQSLTHLTNPRQRLADAGYPTTGPMLVDLLCPADDLDRHDGKAEGYSVLGLEVLRSGDQPGTARGVRVLYSSNGENHVAVYPLGLVLCDDLYPNGPDGETNQDCVVE